VQQVAAMTRHLHASSIVSGGNLGSVTPECVAAHLVRIGYRFQREMAGEGTGILLEPGSGRSRRVVRRIHLWQHDAQRLAYAIDFAPIRVIQVFGAACCAAAVALALLRPTFWCVLLFATALALLAVPEALLAVARQATREALEWAVRCPTASVSRREHPAATFPQFVRDS
jgi:hypothetical protein